MKSLTHIAREDKFKEKMYKLYEQKQKQKPTKKSKKNNSQQINKTKPLTTSIKNSLKSL